MRQIHKAGEKLFIDYCGPTIPIVNPDTGEVCNTQIFVATWGASNYTFAEDEHRQSILAIELDQALLRIESDEYSACIECDEDINIRRLEFVPVCVSVLAVLRNWRRGFNT
jgi:hypothetical protein